jgi:Xaa-Pro aminopeptidase
MMDAAHRLQRARQCLLENDVDALIVSVGRDLPYLTGYEAMPLERLTALVVRADRTPQLFVPGLEVPRVKQHPEAFETIGWSEEVDPVGLVAEALAGAHRVAIGDQMWSRFLVELLHQRPDLSLVRSTEVIGAMRMIKDDDEVAALAAASAAVDRIADDLRTGVIPIVGRTEHQVSMDLSDRILAEGHERVNFAIVATADNAASPHHHPGSRIIGENELVLCDFGGTMDGYCSDITRCVVTGTASAEIREAWEVLRTAQQAGVDAAVVGTPCEEVDRAPRRVIDDAGWGRYFVHRTGHGIGMEEHEDPYMVEGNQRPLEHGHAFSVEPGIYVPGQWGMRLEDIVVATVDGPRRLNNVGRDLPELQ